MKSPEMFAAFLAQGKLRRQKAGIVQVEALLNKTRGLPSKLETSARRSDLVTGGE